MPAENVSREKTDGLPAMDEKDLEMKTTQTKEELFETLKKRGNDFVKIVSEEEMYCKVCLSVARRR